MTYPAPRVTGMVFLVYTQMTRATQQRPRVWQRKGWFPRMDEGTTSVNTRRGLWAMISLGFPDDPKVIEAGYLAELAYLRCTLHARQHLTDGLVHRARASRWLAGIPGDATTHMETLVSVGLMEECPDGWRIPEPVWRKWNPTAEEIEAKAEKARVGAMHTNHKRWHVAKGEFHAECEFCVADRDNPSSDDRYSDRSTIARRSLSGRSLVAIPSPETEKESETETKTTTTSESGPHPSRKQVAFAAAAALMEKHPPAGGTRNPTAYKLSIADRLLSTHEDIDALIWQHGTDDAAALIVERESPTPVYDMTDHTRMRTVYDPGCSYCAGSGWRTVDIDKNIVDHCDCGHEESA